ncbi:MAG: PDGLE domain-containing protein [Deltaproteobacteria bacterium]|jgi:cobalt/nickel transport protein|nr:PDGLE domain-containing protein [Deltaproteobacteria bacterium]
MSETNKEKSSLPIYLGILIISLILAGVVSFFASPLPDGLERVAIEHKFKERAQENKLAPIPDYSFPATDTEFLKNGLAGVSGTILVFAFASGSLWIFKKIKSD